MAAYEVLLLNTAVPQIQAAQSGDTYVVPRDIAFSAALTLSAGTANGVPYLSSPGKVLTTGSALTFDGSGLGIGRTPANGYYLDVQLSGTNAARFTTADYGLIDLTNGTSTLRLQNNGSVPRVATVGAYPLVFAINEVEQMRLTSTGLGIGTNNPGYKLVVVGSISAGQTDGTALLIPRGGFSTSASYTFYGNDTTGISNPAAGVLGFVTGGSERARITSVGNLLVGTTSSSDYRMRVDAAASNHAGVFVGPTAGYASLQVVNTAASGTRGLISFRTSVGGSEVGSITTDGTNTAYNTSSDYRLKDNQQLLTGSGAFIDALKPKTWDWKSGGKGVGFIAHEVAEVSPGTVVGEKDAVDANGKPIMQAMEYGSAEFIANIVAELQSLRARVKAIEGA